MKSHTSSVPDVWGRTSGSKSGEDLDGRGKRMKGLHRAGVVFSLCLALSLPAWNVSLAEQGVQTDLNTPEPPLDAAISVNGKWIYVLTEKGNVLVYSPEGELKEKIPVGENMDRLKAGPLEDLLILSSRRDSLVRLLQVDLIQEIDVSGSPYKGPQEAPVEIVVFSDFQCGFCLQLDSVLEEVHRTFPDEVRIVYKNFPLKTHALAMKAALSALSAGKQGKFWEFHDLLFKNFGKLDDARIAEIARELHLDLDLYEKMKRDSSVKDQLRKDLRQGEKIGLRGVPAVFINGKKLRDRSADGFYHAIDQILMNEK